MMFLYSFLLILFFQIGIFCICSNGENCTFQASFFSPTLSYDDTILKLTNLSIQQTFQIPAGKLITFSCDPYKIGRTNDTTIQGVCKHDQNLDVNGKERLYKDFNCRLDENLSYQFESTVQCPPPLLFIRFGLSHTVYQESAIAYEFCYNHTSAAINYAHVKVDSISSGSELLPISFENVTYFDQLSINLKTYNLTGDTILEAIECYMDRKRRSNIRSNLFQDNFLVRDIYDGFYEIELNRNDENDEKQYQLYDWILIKQNNEVYIMIMPRYPNLPQIELCKNQQTKLKSLQYCEYYDTLKTIKELPRFNEQITFNSNVHNQIFTVNWSS